MRPDTPRACWIVLVAMLVLAGGCASTRGPDVSATPGMTFGSISHAGREHPYAVYVPRGYDPSRRWPAILFLHGRGESGTNGTRQLIVGLPKHMLWDSAEWPFIVIMPQKPDEDSQWEDHGAAVLAILDRAMDQWSIDPERVTLTGLSQGGHGCWTINALAPDRFAALAPVCGYATRPTEPPDGRGRSWEPNPAEELRLARAASTIPVWIFHGDADSVVPAAGSGRMKDLIDQAGGSAMLTVYPGVGHDSWDRAYSDPALRAWLLGQRRPEPAAR